MIDNIDFLYGFIYKCANLINNLYDYDNYNHLAIKLCNEFIMPIINIIKKENIREYNKHIKNIIDIYDICSYLMNICREEYFKLPQNEYLEIKKFIDNNIDIIESALAPMNDYFDSCKNAIVIIIALVIIIIKEELYAFFLRIDIKNFEYIKNYEIIF